MKRNFTTFENIKTNVSLKPCQVFDGFTFWNFGQIFEAIFYEKKLPVKFLMMDLPSGILVKCLKGFSTRKKFCVKFLMMDLFSMGFTFGIFEAVFL